MADTDNDPILDKLRQQEKNLKAKIQKRVTKNNSAQRKVRTRTAILSGSSFISLIEKSKNPDSKYTKEQMQLMYDMIMGELNQKDRKFVNDYLEITPRPAQQQAKTQQEKPAEAKPQKTETSEAT